jgi:hypothetical protein
MTDSSSPSPRPRGAQPGNHNALKHGFYTRRVPGLKDAALEALATEFPGLEEEIFVLRTYIRRTLEWSAACRDYHESLLLLRTLCLALSTLARLTREHRALTADPLDTLARLRQAHTTVSAIERPVGCYPQFLTDMLGAYAGGGDDALLAYFTAHDHSVHDRLPPDTFDRLPDLPFPTPVTLVGPPPAAPQPSAPAAAAAPQPSTPSSPPAATATPQPTSPSPLPPEIATSDPSPIRGIRVTELPVPQNPLSASDPLPALAHRIIQNQDLKGAPQRRYPGRLIDQLPKFTPQPAPASAAVAPAAAAEAPAAAGPAPSHPISKTRSKHPSNRPRELSLDRDVSLDLILPR